VLTPKQRYWQAVTKARIQGDREMREFMEGKRDWLECAGDREREYVIQEIGRAFDAGRGCAPSPPSTQGNEV
jgi:hypothetical protein